jgi:hypothetical protein
MNARWFSIPRLAVLGLVASLPLFLGHMQAAAAGQEASALSVAAPATVTAGQNVTVQARLTGTAGPIIKATVQFVVPTGFLNATADMVVGTGITDGEGLATATFEARMTGDLQVKAVFVGDNTYAPSTGSAPMTVAASKQLYVPDIGIRLRGVNSSPLTQTGSVSHWLLSGWPIGALLVAIWATYGFAVFFMSRISADANNAPEVAP